MTHMLTYLTKIGEKFSEIASYPITWISGFGLFLIDAIGGGKLIIYIVILASIVDLICGIAVSVKTKIAGKDGKKRKGFTKSELIRRTVEKFFVYGFVLLIFLGVDHVIERETGFVTDITAGIVGVVMTLAETVSFTASLLILFPNSAFLRMFQKMLKGELARKLNCDEAEVDKILAESRKVKAQPRAKNGQFVKSK